MTDLPVALARRIVVPTRGNVPVVRARSGGGGEIFDHLRIEAPA